MAVGRPLRRPQAVVPAPPWWITAETCLKSHSIQGQLLKRRRYAGTNYREGNLR